MAEGGLGPPRGRGLGSVCRAGQQCPLTPLENWLSRRAGQGGYAGGFIENYLTWLIYPSGLTQGIQRGLGLLVIVLNAAVYAWVYRSRRQRPVV